MDSNTVPKFGEPAPGSPLEVVGANPQSGGVGKRHLLTDREGAIIALIGSGRSNKEMARELGVAPETIKSHLKRIFQKLSASTRAQAVVRAQNFGLLEMHRR
jgi:DNA-binding CsgD family transcriptional regulator